MKLNSRKLLIVGAIAVGGIWLLSRQKASAAPQVIPKAPLLTGKEAAKATGDPNATVTSTASQTAIKQAVIQDKATHVVVTEPLTSSKQLQAAVEAAVEAVEGTGESAPSVSFVNTDLGAPVTVASESIAQAAAISEMSIQDWGHQQGFW